MEPRTMRVRELIELLSQFPCEEFVWLDGGQPILDAVLTTGNSQEIAPRLELKIGYRAKTCPCGDWNADYP